MDEYQSDKWDLVAENVRFTSEIDIERICAEVERGSRVLDYGCGYGRVTRKLMDAGFSNISGYDTSQAMIQRGRASDPNLPIFETDSLRLPESDAEFDAVIVAGVFTSLPNPFLREQTISELTRLLRPGGRLYLSEFGVDQGRGYDEGACFESSLGVRMKHFTASEMQSLLVDWTAVEVNERQFESLDGSIVPGIHACATRSLSAPVIVRPAELQS